MPAVTAAEVEEFDMMALCSVNARQIEPKRSAMGQTNNNNSNKNNNNYLLKIKLLDSKTVRLFYQFLFFF